MKSYPLYNLIAEKGFDKYQSGLISRFIAYKLTYKLVYSNSGDEPVMNLYFESDSQEGFVFASASGNCRMEVTDKVHNNIVFEHVSKLLTEDDFFQTYPELVIFMRENSLL